MHTTLQPPLINLTVKDSDLIPSETNRNICTIHVWYDGLTPAIAQLDMCGHAFLNYLRNVLGRTYETLKEYWYSVDPEVRDYEVEQYMEWRVNTPATN